MKIVGPRGIFNENGSWRRHCTCSQPFNRRWATSSSQWALRAHNVWSPSTVQYSSWRQCDPTALMFRNSCLWLLPNLRRWKCQKNYINEWINSNSLKLDLLPSSIHSFLCQFFCCGEFMNLQQVLRVFIQFDWVVPTTFISSRVYLPFNEGNFESNYQTWLANMHLNSKHVN